MDDRPDMQRHERDERYPGESTRREPRRELIDAETSSRLRDDWNELRLKFVDDPEAAVREAERLVRDAIGQITESLRRECDDIRGSKKLKSASTEELRERFQRYETLLDRLAVPPVH